MREILFRGKRLVDDNWVEGYYVKASDMFNDDQYDIIVRVDVTVCLDIDKFDGYRPVRPETVGQFTGLTDRNGKKIFEGDIIHVCTEAYDWLDEDDWTIKSGVVKFRNGCFVIDGAYTSDDYNDISHFYDLVTTHDEYDDEIIFDVIGNIHDNPELLEVK